MKIRSIEREISHRLSLGGFESIEPSIRLVAELDSSEDLADAVKELDVEVLKLWNVTVLSELKIVVRRRKDSFPNDDKSRALLFAFKEQLKSITD